MRNWQGRLCLTMAMLCLCQYSFASGMKKARTSPLTTKGDIYTFSTKDNRLPVSADGSLLVADSSATNGVAWQTISASGAPTNATYITQTSNASLSAEQNLAALSTGYMKSAITTGVVTTTATIPSSDVTGTLSVANGGTSATTFTNGGILLGTTVGAIRDTGALAKGVLIVGDGTTDPTQLAVGANGLILSADSAQTSGVKWALTPSYDRGVVVTMTDAATITPDLDLGKVFRVTLGGNRTLGVPQNGIDGHSYIFIISQDVTGTRTLAYSPFYRFGSDVTSPTLSTAAGKNDYLGMVYNIRRSGKISMDVVATALGYSEP